MFVQCIISHLFYQLKQIETSIFHYNLQIINLISGHSLRDKAAEQINKTGRINFAFTTDQSNKFTIIMKSAKQQANSKPQQQSPQSSQKEGSVGGQSNRQQTTPQSASRTRGQKKVIENGPGSISPINALDSVLTSHIQGEPYIPQQTMVSPVASSGQVLGPPLTPTASSTKQRASRALKLQSIPEESTKNTSSGGQSTTGINQESAVIDKSQGGAAAASVISLYDNILSSNIAPTGKLIKQEDSGEKESKKVVKAKLIKEETKKDSAANDFVSLSNLNSEEEEEEDEDVAIKSLIELEDEDQEALLAIIEEDDPVSKRVEELGTQKVVVLSIVAAGVYDRPTITDKEFYKAMQKVKDRGTNAVPPKKSASAYILFGKEKRAEILKRNPMAKVTEVVKEIAQSWKILTKEDRQKYKEAAKRDKDRYEKELRALESHSDMLKKPKKCLSAYMIFVKETRPLIVEEHPEMGALQVMQQVGKQWQQMTEQSRSEFKCKADRDKVRYLDEQRAFYDEVEKIGKDVGTVITKEGKVVVASTIQHNLNPMETTGGKKGSKAANKVSTAEAQGLLGSSQMAQEGAESMKNGGSNLLTSKRKVPESSETLMTDGGTPTKRFKLEDQASQNNQNTSLVNKIGSSQQTMFPGQMPISISIPAGTPGMQPQWQNQYPMGQVPINQPQDGSQQANLASQESHLQPKKPLSAYIYFSQEFRDIIRQRFSFLTMNQIRLAITYRWKLLTKEQKQPFEQIATEDKQRYDRDLTLFKKGTFPGRSQAPKVKVSIITTENSENVSQALFINEELINFIQNNCQHPSQANNNVKKEGTSSHEDLPTDLNEDDLEALKDAENNEGMMKSNDSNNHLTMQTANHHTGGNMSEMGMMMGGGVPQMQDQQHYIPQIPQQILHQQQDHLIGSNPGLIGSSLDPAMMHMHGMLPNYNQQLLHHPNGGGYAYNYYGQPTYMPPNLQHNQQMMPPPQSFIDQMNKYQMQQQQPVHNQQQMSFYNTIQNSLGAGQSGFGGGYGNGFDTSIHSNRNYLQNELQNREYDRKTSMSFGFGQSMFPSNANHFGASPALHAQSGHQNIISSPNIQMQNPYLGGLDDPHIQQANAAMSGYFLPGSNSGAPFQLPPSNIQAQQQSHSSWGATSATQQNSSQAQASNTFMKPPSPFMLPPQSQRKISSPQLGPSVFGPSSAPALMHNVSFSNSGLFPQTSNGSNGGHGHQQSNMDQLSNISPFLTPSSNPQIQGNMLYQSPSFGALSGSSMQSALHPSGAAQNPFNRSSVPGVGTPASLLHPNSSIE